MKDLPSLDLSQFETSETLPIKIERIIIQALVFYKMDIKKVAKKYNLSEEKISSIAIEYYTSITASIDSQTNIKSVNRGLKDSTSLLLEHIKNIKKAQDNSQSKVLTEANLRNICKIMDRLNDIQSNYSKLTEISTTKLASTINSSRTTDASIEGKPENDSEYNENVETVFTKLRTTKFRKIKATNVVTKEVRHYDSITEAATDLLCNGDSIRKRLQDKKLHRNEWAFEEEK